jgi:sulfur-carrier protein
MKIKLKLYATLTDYLPAEAVNHATEVEIPTSATASQILDNFKVPRQMAAILILTPIGTIYCDFMENDHNRLTKSSQN